MNITLFADIIMKKLSIYTLIGLLFFACKSEPARTDYIIKGTAKDVYNGIRVHLNTIDANGRESLLATEMVVNEGFSFKGVAETPDLATISINSIPGKLPFMLENSEIHIDIDKSNLAESKVTGSKSHQDFEAYQSGLLAIKNDVLSNNTVITPANPEKELSLKELRSKQLIAIETETQDYTIKFIKENKDSFYSLFLIEQETRKASFDIENYMDIYNNLSSRLKSSTAGVAVKTKLDGMFKTYQRTAQIQIGKIAPNFEAPTPEGNIVSLNDIKGKVTIIDFWAAWCGPCRRENPNVVRIYNKYHLQGLEIIGVSLDGTPTQRDPKQAWIDAINSDQLAWTQVSNLKYFNEPIAQLYNITSIPATYILDSQGKIVAKNLRGRALELKVEELLQQQH